MRSFGSLAFRQVGARRLRALLTAAGIVLGVGMIVGVLVLAATIQRTFTDLFDSVYGKTDVVVSGTDQTSLPGSTLRKVRRTREVADAEGRISTVFSLVDRFGRAEDDASSQLNVGGEDPEASNLTDAETVAGRRPRRGQGFATVALGEARELMEKPRAYDEVNVVVDGGRETIGDVRGRLKDGLGRGVRVLTPSAKSNEVEAQLQGCLLYT